MEDFTTFICYQLKATMKKVEKYIAQQMAEFGVNMAQSFILFSLLEKDGSTLSEIGNRSQIENSSLTTMVDKLEKEGLVERRLYAQDRRVIKLYLTEKGRELGQKILDEGSKFNKYLRNNMGEATPQFLEALNRISESIDQLNDQQKTKKIR
ncbi:MarR family transcriptional regulator [Thermosyntropha sp.]|uniref:MarR family winged helix-turn-helix transcriptional regulator n=1 Tax=Thermosyntropha sp. TaxID=2740820 RepID=UPI0025EE5A4D|nr:MarR family transcriptional regulator [Thermosyntropha sp.]MBO8159274.1 MarR family transcriptional regulator [Thermosyntropha sp.]